MIELLEHLPNHSHVLDLGAGPGSFTMDRPGLCVVRLDLEVPAARKGGDYVSADAARMPFRSQSFDVIISNHSLEHFCELEATVREIGRVIQPDGALYAAVPDAGSLADRVYRWLGKGGGHVNPFRSPEEVVALIQRHTGLEHRGTRVLFSSFSFLNRHNFRARPPRKIALFAFGNERFLALTTWILRWFDRRFQTGLSRYGWSFYFGSAGRLNTGRLNNEAPWLEKPWLEKPWMNVCVRCGSGASEAFLRKTVAVRWGAYRCPVCGGWNLITSDRAV
jgi:SAM-dependent methyltransferase